MRDAFAAPANQAGFSSTGLSVSQTLCAPAQPFGDLLQRLDLHTGRPVGHEVPVPAGLAARIEHREYHRETPG